MAQLMWPWFYPWYAPYAPYPWFTGFGPYAYYAPSGVAAGLSKPVSVPILPVISAPTLAAAPAPFPATAAQTPTVQNIVNLQNMAFANGAAFSNFHTI